MSLSGLHHVTAIASDPQRNLDFHAGTLGLRLVKRTVNFDDPGSYHFYFGDGLGRPGTILTFFPWPGARRGSRGTGEVTATAFGVRPESAGFWMDRLEAHGITVERRESRFEEDVLRFAGPDGMPLELILSPAAVEPWAGSTIPAEHALHGLHSVSAALEGYERTVELLTGTLGYRLAGESDNRCRFAAPGEDAPGRFIDLLCLPDSRPASSGAGSVHHIAFRVKDDAEQQAWRERLVSLGYNVSPIMDRTYFRSIYFREPGGILFEIATDGPGFTIDEPAEELGRRLQLPPRLERARERIEEILPTIRLPKGPAA